MISVKKPYFFEIWNFNILVTILVLSKNSYWFQNVFLVACLSNWWDDAHRFGLLPLDFLRSAGWSSMDTARFSDLWFDCFRSLDDPMDNARFTDLPDCFWSIGLRSLLPLPSLNVSGGSAKVSLLLFEIFFIFRSKIFASLESVLTLSLWASECSANSSSRACWS